MARRKRKLEQIESIAERSQPQAALPPEAIEDIRRTINDAWTESQANPKVRNRDEGLQLLHDLIEAETNTVKKQFHERIFGIADRVTHCSKPLSVSDQASQPKPASDSDVLPLRQRIKSLREQKS